MKFGLFNRKSDIESNNQHKLVLDKGFNYHWWSHFYVHIIAIFLIVGSFVAIMFNNYYHLRADSKGKKTTDFGYELVKSLHDFVGNIQRRKLIIIQGDVMEPLFLDGSQACLDIENKRLNENNLIIYQGTVNDDLFIRKIVSLPGSTIIYQEKSVKLADDEYYVEVENKDSEVDNKKDIVKAEKILGKIIYGIKSSTDSVRCLARS